jgi:hypothetical protein
LPIVVWFYTIPIPVAYFLISDCSSLVPSSPFLSVPIPLLLFPWSLSC